MMQFDKWNDGKREATVVAWGERQIESRMREQMTRGSEKIAASALKEAGKR